MNKKLMAVAVAGALAAPALAFAQASNVQIYGRINVGFDNYSATGSSLGSVGDLKSRNRVFDQGSRLGFRGTEDLGGGLKAVWLIESGINADSGSQLGQGGAGQGANANTGFLASRYANAGLEGNFGRVTFGKSDIWWGNGLNDRVVSTYVGVGNSWTTFGRGMSVGIARQANTLQYTSPTYNGFNAVVSYSPNAQEATAANLTANGRIWALTINGTVGQFRGGWDYIDLTANSPAVGIQPKTTGNKFRIGWGYQPGAQVSFIYNKSKQTAGTANAALAGGGGLFTAADTNISQDALGVSWEHTFGNFHVMAQYTNVRDAKGCQGTVSAAVAAATGLTAGNSLCANTNAKETTVAVRYLLSKRTDVYMNYSQFRNDAAYNVDHTATLMSSNPGGAGTLAVGADPKVFGVGLSHWF